MDGGRDNNGNSRSGVGGKGKRKRGDENWRNAATTATTMMKVSSQTYRRGNKGLYVVA